MYQAIGKTARKAKASAKAKEEDLNQLGKVPIASIARKKLLIFDIIASSCPDCIDVISHKRGIFAIIFIAFKISSTTCHSKTQFQRTGKCTGYLRSININVIPSFGHIVNVAEGDKNKVVRLRLCSSGKYNTGDRPREPSTPHPRTSILLVMLLSACGKLLRSQLTANISTNMLRDQD
jgi:hypothetical protein